jgi:hypothetical protein
VTFAPGEIAFQNGKSLALSGGGQMLFRPEAKKKKVAADLYKVTSQDDPVLESGNRLCKGKPVAYVIVWKSERVGKETDPRTFGTVLRAATQSRFTTADATSMTRDLVERPPDKLWHTILAYGAGSAPRSDRPDCRPVSPRTPRRATI